MLVRRTAFLAVLVGILSVSTLNAQQYYIVAKGDCVERIAKRYRLKVGELMALNHLTSDVIQPGQRLLVSRTTTEASQKTDKNVTLRTVKTYHTVIAGESLSSMAQRYDTSVAELKKLNSLRSSRIRVGDRLLVKVTTHEQEVPQEMPAPKAPGKTTATAGTARPAAAPKQTAGQIAKEQYALLQQLDLVKSLSQEDASGKVLSTALSFLGTPYRYGGNTYRGIDCSGLVKKSYDSIGLDLPRTSRSQYLVGTAVTLGELQPGDLVFFRRRSYSKTIGHVGLYVGDGYMVHAASHRHKVVLEKLTDTEYLMERYAGARRILTASAPRDEEYISP